MTTHGWTTGDPASIAIWEHLPSGLRCQLVLEDDAGHLLTPTAWQPVEEYLPRGDGNSLAHLVVMAEAGRVEIECAGQGDVGACRIDRVEGEHLRAHWEVDGVDDGWQVRGDDTAVVITPRGTEPPADLATFLTAQTVAARRPLPHGGGLLAAPLAAIEAIVAANTVHLPDTDEVITVSRHEAEAAGAWRLPNWETFLTALGIAYLDPELAVANCLSAIRHLAAGGMLGASAGPDGPHLDFSNPPVASYAVWKVYQLTGDATLLDAAYAPLLRWHDWWRDHRDGNHNHLLAWQSSAESGMPGHPLYDEAALDDTTGLLRLDDVGLCGLWALDTFALMRMALAINDLDQATHLETELRDIVERVNHTLWEPMHGTYLSHDWHGTPTTRQSATVLLALTGAIPSNTRLRHLVNDHLLFEFDAPFLVPTVGDGDPAFAEQLPWRGRVSPLLNLLIGEGFRRYGADVQAERITLSGLELLRRGWQAARQAYASYNAIDGRGDDIAQDPLAPVSILFGTMGMTMLLDMEPWNGMRLGNLHGAEMSITRFPLRGHRYDIASGPGGITAYRDGQAWIDTDRPAILRNLMQHDHEISLRAKCAGGGPLRLRFHAYAPRDRVVVKVNGVAHPVTVDRQGVVTVTAEVGGE